MTEQELIDLRDNLLNLNNTLIGMLERIESLESSALPKGQYFEQIIASFEDSPECCGCDGGDTGGGDTGGGDTGGGDTGGGDTGGGNNGGDTGGGNNGGGGDGGSGGDDGTDPVLEALSVTVDYTMQGAARIANENPVSSGNAIVRGTVNFPDAQIILKISPEHVDKPPIDKAELGFTYGYLQYGSLIPDFDEYEEYLATNHDDGTWTVILPANLPAGRYPICVQATHRGRVEVLLPTYPSYDGNIYLWRDQFLQVYIEANVSLKSYATPVVRQYPNNIEDTSGRAEQFFPTILGYRDYDLASAISAFTSLANDTIGIHCERDYSSNHYAQETVTHRVFSRTMSAVLLRQPLGYQVKKYDYTNFNGVYTMSNIIPPTPTTPEYVAGVLDGVSIGKSISFWTPNPADNWVDYVDNVASAVCMYLTPLLIAEE